MQVQYTKVETCQVLGARIKGAYLTVSFSDWLTERWKRKVCFSLVSLHGQLACLVKARRKWKSQRGSFSLAVLPKTQKEPEAALSAVPASPAHEHGSACSCLGHQVRACDNCFSLFENEKKCANRIVPYSRWIFALWNGNLWVESEAWHPVWQCWKSTVEWRRRICGRAFDTHSELGEEEQNLLSDRRSAAKKFSQWRQLRC